jgi:hypothetical protein
MIWRCTPFGQPGLLETRTLLWPHRHNTAATRAAATDPARQAGAALVLVGGVSSTFDATPSSTRARGADRRAGIAGRAWSGWSRTPGPTPLR